MLKNFLLIFALLLFSHCSTPGAALLGPTFTGASTKSVARTTLSLGSNQMVASIREKSKKNKEEIVRKFKNIQSNISQKELIFFHK